MGRKSYISITPEKLLKIFLIFSIFEGLFVFYSLFQVQSDFDNAIFLGFSLRRLLIGLVAFAILGMLLMILIHSYRPFKIMSLIGRKFILFLENKRFIISIQTGLILLLFSMTSVLLIYFFPGFQRFYPFIKGVSIIQAIGERGGVFLIWISLIICKFIIINYLYFPKKIPDCQSAL